MIIIISVTINQYDLFKNISFLFVCLFAFNQTADTHLVFKDSSPSTPLIFVLSAEDEEMGHRFSRTHEIHKQDKLDIKFINCLKFITIKNEQPARKRTCNHSEFEPKLQTARKHTRWGFLFEKEQNRSIKNIRKRRFQIDIYEIEVDRAEDLKSKVNYHL